MIFEEISYSHAEASLHFFTFIIIEISEISFHMHALALCKKYSFFPGKTFGGKFISTASGKFAFAGNILLQTIIHGTL